MNETVEKIKSLKIEHLPNIIGDLNQQKNDLVAELNDLKKVRIGLDEKAEPGK